MKSRWLKWAGLRREEKKCTYSYVLNTKDSGEETTGKRKISPGDNIKQDFRETDCVVWAKLNQVWSPIVSTCAIYKRQTRF